MPERMPWIVTSFWTEILKLVNPLNILDYGIPTVKRKRDEVEFKLSSV